MKQFFCLTRIFHRSCDEEVAKADEARQVMNGDDGCMQTYRPRNNSSLTKHSSLFPASAVKSDEIFGLSHYKKIIAALFWFLTICCLGRSADRFSPDTVFMKNGTLYHGLIIKNDAKEIVLQQDQGEFTIDKKKIQRINDAKKTMVYFDDLIDPDKLPPWRMMVQELRTNDAVKSFIQIPAARITQGYLRNVPYLSFQMNKYGAMNIFGDPKNPACVELGVYAQRGAQLKKFQEIARQFLAGFMTSRKEIGIIYHLNLQGDQKRLGNFIYRITPPKHPQSHGGWWISVYDPQRLDHARISNKEYEKITLPAREIRTKDGRVRHKIMNKQGHFLNPSMVRWIRKIPRFHGFYRNRDNELKVVPLQKLS